MNLKRTLGSLGAVAALTLGVLTTGSAPASAGITTQCTGHSTYTDTAGYYVKVPTDYMGGSNFCAMSQGASGEQVRWLQETLWQCYGQNIVSDGQFGPATAAALKKVQAALNLSADGVYGPQTRDAIKWNWILWETGGHRCLRLTQAPGPLR
ncbi:peptidoglycan-binding domain-containing protein [Streptomyces sp. NPDC046203]|uniref:peptidoglycan-binding domain-containing protein n=1 Tax=Streptomyces sp. NPDC046203 TaxID=3154602 RepID=UPI0034076895